MLYRRELWIGKLPMIHKRQYFHSPFHSLAGVVKKNLAMSGFAMVGQVLNYKWGMGILP